MLERQVLIPASPRRLWEALTEPDSVSTWLGATVEWDLTPGGRARFTEDEGAVRHGMVQEVEPARHLRFRWWPEGEDADAASEVTYDLEPDGDGTRLTVTERPVAADGAATIGATNIAATNIVSAGAPACWTQWDTRFAVVWGRMAAPAAVRAR